VGLRATYGRIPTYGDTHLAQNAVVGVVTTTVADTALLLDVTAGPDGRDRTCLPAPPVRYAEALSRVNVGALRVAWSSDLGFAVLDAEVAALCEQASVALVQACGAKLVSPPIQFSDFTRTYSLIECVDRFVGIDPMLWETRLDELDPLIAPGWTSLSKKTLPEAAVVEAARRELVTQVAGLFDEVDLLVTPMASVLPFDAAGPMPTEIGGVVVHQGMSVVLSFLASLANLPAISIPAGLSATGLPVGIQVIGPRFREDLVLAAAARLEAARPWPRHAPSTATAG
jgi:aspartyl-tRNA(Asn)/glutamyl-tRNA(Gln) amidotransferase subunit A